MKKLYRSRSDRKIAGVVGGIAKYLNVDANLLRLITVLLMFLSCLLPIGITYIVAWVLLPEGDPDEAAGTP